MTAENIINICLSCDDNYAEYAGVVIASVLANANSEDNLHFYILDGGISDENKHKIEELKNIKNCEIHFVDIDKNLFSDYKEVKTHKYISIAAYYRLKIPSLLSNIKKVIYFDCDIVVNTSLKKLYERNIDKYLLAGVSDIKKKDVKKNPYYVNSGMLVMNLEKMREDNTEEKFLNYTKSRINTITKGDQEILNEVCKDDIMVLPPEWNVQVSNFVNRSNYTNSPKIIHYVSKNKPWKFGSYSYFKNYWFKYLQLTPWALKDEEKPYWYAKNQIFSVLSYIKYRPLFFLRPRFYKAQICTYLLPFLKKTKLFYFMPYKETHYLVYILGLKIKLLKPNYFFKRQQNLYYYYKKNKIDITKIPPATGQIREIQLANLALLRELDYVCNEANLKYWLDFGTLLGAVRHKGFIPWDDDIDVSMMREDYNQIISAFEKYSRNPDIHAELYFDSSNNGLIKVRHKKCKYLFVDIFPYDEYGAKLSTEDRYKYSKKIKKFRKKQFDKDTKISGEEILSKCEQMRNIVLHKEDKKNGDVIYGLEYNHHWKNWIYPADTIFPLKNIEFENEIFPAIHNPEAYLRSVYGNYMAYPKKIGMGHSMYAELTTQEKEVISSLAQSQKGKSQRVITYGTFDVLHYGHINLLRRAKELGDYLIVALSTDEFNKLKNKKSLYTYEQRKTLLEACRYVDMVIPVENWEQKVSDVKKYNIDTFVMGDDWEGKFDFLKDYCKVIYLPRTPDVSSTQTKNYLAYQNIPKVSVIVPVYNVEKYLHRCLDSILRQTLKDIEVICVNDGSEDSSLSILKEYSRKDARIKVITQKNQGLSAARNTGFTYAHGEYISFVDSDDWISLNFLEKLYKSAKKYDADISVASIIRCKKHYRKPIIKYIYPICTQDYEEKLELCDIPSFCYVWNKLYRRQALIDADIKFENGRIYEDILFTPYILFKTKNLATAPGAKYYYFRHKKTLVKEKSKKAYSDCVYANKKMYEFFKSQNIDVSNWAEKTKKYRLFGLTMFKIITKRDKKEYVLFNLIRWKNKKF